jgi:AraC-like DNA-binding protein
MSILMQYLHVIGVFQGFVLAGLLIWGPKNSTANRILGTWCLFLGLNFLGPFIYINGELNVFSSLIGLHHFLPASYGAFIYLYCRHAIIDKPLALKELLHFTPFILCYLLNIELYLSSAEIKLEAILHEPRSLTPIIAAQVILTLQSFIYIGFSMTMVRGFQRKANQTLSNFNPEMFTWLWKLLLLDLIIWLLKSTAEFSSELYFLSIAGDILIIVFIYSIAMAQWRNPTLFKIAQLATSEPEQETEFDVVTAKNTELCEEQTKKQNGALDPEIRKSLLTAVIEKMKTEQPYLDSQLTLTRLAEIVGISTHHLSEVLNQHQGKNFYQFVNEYRINFVCQQLKHDQETKIIDLAMTAGFSSKSTFNAVFKQLVNMTTSQYRRALVK